MLSQVDTLPPQKQGEIDQTNIIRALLALALVLTLARWMGFLPEWAHRIPEFILPPFEALLDKTFNFINVFR